MEQLTTPFEQHDLVWAKVQHYPWWPGKILEIFQQNHSLIFKISFYADPTYCYVQEQALIPFHQFRQQLNANFTIDGQLQRAIILANNAFQRKKLSQQNTKPVSLPITPTLYEPQQSILEEPSLKGEEFEQETIPIDFEGDNSNGKMVKVKKATQIQNLLKKYKLDKIPVFFKQTKIAVQQEALEEGLQSEEQEQVELVDLRMRNKKKSIKKKINRKIKRKHAGSMTVEQGRTQLMKRTCSILIEKGVEAQTSRQIVLKMMEKTEQGISKVGDFHSKKINNQTVYVKLLRIVADIEATWDYEQKLVHVFRSVDSILFQMGMMEKEQEQKTNIIQADEEQISVVC